jgi:hypothetical protein
MSARADLDYAEQAMNLFMAFDDKILRYHALLSFVICYARPFTENSGIGPLKVEYPDYPNTMDDQVCKAHHRIIDMRNNFFCHSCAQGSQVVLLAPGATDPGTNQIVDRFTWNIAKREFPDKAHAQWLKTALIAIQERIDKDLNSAISNVSPKYFGTGDIFQIDTAHADFQWTEEYNKLNSENQIAKSKHKRVGISGIKPVISYDPFKLPFVYWEDEEIPDNFQEMSFSDQLSLCQDQVPDEAIYLGPLKNNSGSDTLYSHYYLMPWHGMEEVDKYDWALFSIAFCGNDHVKSYGLFSEVRISGVKDKKKAALMMFKGLLQDKWSYDLKKRQHPPFHEFIKRIRRM